MSLLVLLAVSAAILFIMGIFVAIGFAVHEGEWNVFWAMLLACLGINVLYCMLETLFWFVAKGIMA